MKRFRRSAAWLLIMAMVLALLGGIVTLGEEVTHLTIHYKPVDDKEWNIWAWPEGEEGKVYRFTEEDSFGKVAKVEIPGKHTKVGFIVRTDSWEKYGGDRIVDLTKGNQVWVIDDKEFSYVEPSKMVPAITSAEISALREITVRFNLPYDSDRIKNAVKLDEGKVTEVINGNDDRTLILKTDTDIALDKENHIEIEGYERAVVTPGSVVRSKEFDERYYYDGPLGPQYTKDKTEVILWAPTAMKVSLNIYGDTEPDSPVKESLPMTKGEKGTWRITLEGDRKNIVYDYTLTFAGLGDRNSQDPYSRSVTINGERTVIFDPEDVKVDGFDRMPSFSSNVDAVIYEVHIRDFSINEDSGISNKGKFLGFTESGTKNSKGTSTGLDYLKSLGITHVQLLPIYDFASIDETRNDQYNWGYDPENYNVPEGSYSTDPKDPLKRITELKTMIRTLHDNGIRVIMDVVYNHVYDVNSSALEKTVPGYYFRHDRKGNLGNGSGVGNDTASERLMMRRLIVESCIYWATEYRLDGFRFDLMGIHDIDTMNIIRNEINKIDPHFIILGEGWDLNTELPGPVKATQKNAFRLPGIAFFNDSIRDGIKGSVFEGKDKGFISGEKYMDHVLSLNMTGSLELPDALATYLDPGQVIQYTEAHDNFTMFDKLMISDPKDDMDTRKKRHMLGTSIVLLSQGVPFIHGGQEFLRTKGGEHNSYKSPDSVNMYDWGRIDEMSDAVQYFRELVQFRKNTPLLRLRTEEEIRRHVSILHAKGNLIAISLKDDKDEYIMIFNGMDKEQSVSLGEGEFLLISDGVHVNENSTTSVQGPAVRVPGITSYILKRKL